MADIFEFLLNVLAEIFGEALFKSMFYVLPSLVWAAGAYCLVWPMTRSGASPPAAVVALLCGGLLTYFWAQGSTRARNTLLAGVFFSLGVVAMFLVGVPPA
jgi:hypothetical protein